MKLFIHKFLFILGVISSLALAQPLRLSLDWFPSAEFAGILAAQEKGWYSEAGIELELVFEDAALTDKVQSQNSDFGLLSSHEVLRAIAEGKDLKVFASHFQFNPHTLILPRKSPCKSIADLKGKTLGVFDPHEYDIYRVILKKHGLSLEDVRFKTLPSMDPLSLITLLKSRQVDAFLSWEFHWPLVFAMNGYPVRQFPCYKNGFYFYGPVYFSKTDFIVEHRDLLRKFIQVTGRGWQEVFRRPNHYIKNLVHSRYPRERYIQNSESKTRAEQLLEVKLSRRYLYEGIAESSYGQMSRYFWEKSLSLAKASGMLPAASPLTVDDVLDASVLKPSRRRD